MRALPSGIRRRFARSAIEAEDRRPVILQRGIGYADQSPDPLRMGRWAGSSVRTECMPERGKTGTLNLQRFLSKTHK